MHTVISRSLAPQHVKGVAPRKDPWVDLLPAITGPTWYKDHGTLVISAKETFHVYHSYWEAAPEFCRSADLVLTSVMLNKILGKA